MFRYTTILAFGLLVCRLDAFEWRTTNQGRHAALVVPAQGKPGFTSLPASQTGIGFTNRLTETRGLTNQIYMSGSGVAFGDFDRDGWCDLYFCGLDSPNVLYRNLGNWRFENVTPDSGPTCSGQASTGAAFADMDGDDDLDLLVTGLGAGVRLFINDGKGRFSETTREAGLTSQAASMSMALGDIDGDGDLDLYVANYRTSSLQDEPGLRFKVSTTNRQSRITHIDGRPITPEESERYFVSPHGKAVLENGEADLLYRNEGRGKFSVVLWTDGSFLDEEGKPAPVAYDWGLSVMFRDMNGDRAPDIYVCNDSDSADRIWINDGSGKFRAMSRLALRQTCLASMGVDFADINRDGHDDFFVADMLGRAHAVRHTQVVDLQRLHTPGDFESRKQFMRNMLYLNRGDGTYAEIAQFSGVDASDWSWMPIFLDVDLDGFEDLLVTTGLERSLRDADARRHIDAVRAQRQLSKTEFLELRKIMPRLTTPNYAFRNRGDLTFEIVSGAWGFDSAQVSHGMALGDLDNDGDLDLAVNCMNEPALIYRNNSAAPRIAVRLRGKAPNTRGVGARITVTGGPVSQGQEIISGGRYLSSDEPQRVFAAGHETNTLSVEVLWRSGHKTILKGAQANTIVEVDEPAASAITSSTSNSASMPMFQDATMALNHRHLEQLFNDFDHQPLLPRQLSQSGPGICWCDLNRDGWDDLVIPAARGSALGVFLNNRSGGFGRVDTTGVTGRARDDQTTALSWPSEASTTLLVGTSACESGNASGVERYEIWAGGVEVRDAVPVPGGSAGPLALADVDADGDLDLFAGARSLPGKYPEPAPSRILINDAGRFQSGQEFSAVVNGALFSDLNGDGFPELVLACDWGPLRVYRNTSGKFGDATEELGLGQFRGWWNAVSSGDFDGDGRLDLVAANWGRNTKFEFYRARPLHAFFGDLDENGVTEFIAAYHDPDSRKVVPWLRWDAMGQALPGFEQKFSTFKAYSTAGVEEIFGERLKTMKSLEVNTLDSMIFLNRGRHFEARALPVEAQFAPAFGICASDFDGDGAQDIFFAQNFFAVDLVTSRYDAGRGLLLRGDGKGAFAPVGATNSGIAIYGEQRGAAVADFDRDGRVDLAVAQNGAATRLLHNASAKPGLRVRLSGPPGNPAAFGAVVRGGRDSNPGPSQEVRAGGGYWSQDSAAIIVTSSNALTKLWVRWPGGKETTHAIPAGAREVILGMDGRIDVAK
jgi:enediyne biosynthesis protein E4